MSVIKAILKWIADERTIRALYLQKIDDERAKEREVAALRREQEYKRREEYKTRKHLLMTKENPTDAEMAQLANMVASEKADAYAQKVAQEYEPIGDY